MARTVRTRITLLATFVTLGVCLLVCIAVYAGLTISLYREVDGFLDGEVREFTAMLRHDEAEDLHEIEQEIRLELGSRRNADLTFRLLDDGGRLLITSDPNDHFPMPSLRSDNEDKSHETWFETVTVPPTSVPFRFCNRRQSLPGHPSVVVQAVYRLDRVVRSLAICRWTCFVALLFAAVLSVLGGRAVARRSLAPVVRITEAAKQISAQRLSSRVPIEATHDELDELATTLNAMLERVERSFRQIQQFTADAAHELRTPLTALRGSAEVALAQNRSESELRTVIETSLDYYRILGRVTDDLLLLARLDAGQEPLRYERFRLTKAIDDIVDLYRPLAHDREIEIDGPADGDVWVQADPAKVRRVLSNLVDNAIKYMNGAGAVSLSLNEQNGDVVIGVRDTGPGIGPDDLPHVFERFYRADRARTAKRDNEGRSAGLGLAICKSIIEAHGGQISIECPPGAGTAVSIHLPSRPSEGRETRV